MNSLFMFYKLFLTWDYRLVSQVGLALQVNKHSLNLMSEDPSSTLVLPVSGPLDESLNL